MSLFSHAQRLRLGLHIAVLIMVVVLVAGCAGNAMPGENGEQFDTAETLALPTVAARVAGGGRLQVLATTSTIGDVVHQVGGDAIDLVVLMQPGQDPHSYQPGAADLTAAADADVIFINGWNLEEGLVGDLTTIARKAVIVPISAGIAPRGLAAHSQAEGEESLDHGPADPHVWQDVANVIQWADNVRQVLSAADPTNAATYEANAERYRAALEQLDVELRASLQSISPEKRVIITNHDNLGYFADAYGFDVVGTVIPSVSTLAEPTAGALAELVQTMQAAGICTLVVETTASDQLARTLENELTSCDNVKLITLYTDALGPSGGGAGTYIDMMLANAAALVEGLR